MFWHWHDSAESSEPVSTVWSEGAVLWSHFGQGCWEWLSHEIMSCSSGLSQVPRSCYDDGPGVFTHDPRGKGCNGCMQVCVCVYVCCVLIFTPTNIKWLGLISILWYIFYKHFSWLNTSLVPSMLRLLLPSAVTTTYLNWGLYLIVVVVVFNGLLLVLYELPYT